MSRRSATALPGRTDFYNQAPIMESAIGLAGSDEHPGIPQRPPAYAHLLIDSRDRGEEADGLLKENANDFILSAKGNAALLYGYFTRVAITQVNFDWFVPTLLANYWDSVRVTNTTTGNTATINLITAGATTSGYFTPDDLATVLEDALKATAGVGNAALTVTYNALYGGLEYATNDGSALQFVSPLAADPTRGPLYKNLLKTYRVLGISNAMMSTAVNTNIGSPVRGPTSYVDILSERLTKFQRVKDADTDQSVPRSTQIARLYLCPPGQRVIVSNTSSVGGEPFTICVDYNTPKQIKWSPNEALYQVDLQVRDMDGDLLPWDGETANWEYQLTCVASET